jgi:hypothetical protein
MPSIPELYLYDGNSGLSPREMLKAEFQINPEHCAEAAIKKLIEEIDSLFYHQSWAFRISA